MDIEINKLVKEYDDFRALDTVSLDIKSGMFGLLGPNGAGKTTLMRVIATLLPVTAGTVRVGGVDVMQNPAAIRQNLGYIPQKFGFYPQLNAYETLDYIATMKGLSRTERHEQIEALLAEVNLLDAAQRRVGGYSGGMKQRLCIAQALLGNPSLLVVDEPTAGLDPEERIRFRNLLVRISGERTVLLSTHIVADIEASCTALAVLHRGCKIYQGTPESLREQAAGQVWDVTVQPDEWEHFQQHYRITRSRPAEGITHLRIIAPENPQGRGTPATAELEDGYMAVIEAHNDSPSQLEKRKVKRGEPAHA